ncbi:ABC transporter permease [Nocardia sp. NPDC020380]|uniref:ABC transporter permease n=1 Tax=Nocardia sp. NPDC020380 TaxID=3364309 RepID=UPI0037996466
MLNAIRYEVTRLTTVRSTWALLAAGMAMQAFIAFVYAGKTDMTADDRFVQSFHGLPLILVTLFTTAVAVNSFGHEYRYRTITTTMLTLRRPGRVLAAKASVSAIFAAASAAAMVVLTLVIEAARAGAPTDIGLIARIFGAVMLYAALAALVGMGIAAVTRNATIAMVATLAIPTVVEVAALLFGISIRILPFSAAAQLVQPRGLNVLLLPLPLMAMAAGLLTASGVLLARRDV